MTLKLLIATRNPGKFREIRELVAESPLELAALDELVPDPEPEEAGLESGTTFVENACRKARHFHDRTGLPTLAEDSGLRVDALGGAPGTRSKRFAPASLQAEQGQDRANNLHLLERLRGVPEAERTAHFVSAVAIVLEGGGRAFRGRVDGRILTAPRGEGGFGYDPLFFIPELGRTTAELQMEEKNRISHRARAIAAAREWLSELAESETSRRGSP